MPIKDELLEELLKDYKNPEDLLGKDGLLGQRDSRAQAGRRGNQAANC